MQQVLEMRSFDDRLFDVDCTDLLDDDEVIQGEVTVVVDDSALTVTNPIANPAPIRYPLLNRTAQIGKAVQMRIAVAAGAAVPYVERLYTIRVRFATNINAAIEATVQMRVIDRA